MSTTATSNGGTSNGGTGAATLASLQDDVATLTRDVSSLFKHLQAGATDSLHDGASRLDDGAQAVYRGLAEQGGRSATAVRRQITAQPVTALLLALGVGFIGGRLLLR